jgi:NitT/TauT family transport system substrate-binding protein
MAYHQQGMDHTSVKAHSAKKLGIPGRPPGFTRLALSCCIVSCLICVSCSRDLRDSRTHLKVAVLPFLSYGPLFIAAEEGYFAGENLRVEFVKMNRSAQAVPLLIEGQLDVLTGTLTPALLNAIARGARIRLVADKGFLDPDGCDYNALVAQSTLIESGELDSPAALSGRRIVLEPNEFRGYFVEAFLRQSGLSLHDIRPVDIPDAAMMDAFEQGTIELAATAEPWITRLVQTGKVKVWRPAQQVLPGFQVGAILYGPSILDGNRDAGRRFARAYLRAVRQYNLGKTERNRAILAKHTGLDPDVLQQACWPSFRGDGRINVRSVLDYEMWALSKGLLDRVLAQEQFWDPQFIQDASPGKGARPE